MKLCFTKFHDPLCRSLNNTSFSQRQTANQNAKAFRYRAQAILLKP